MPRFIGYIENLIDVIGFHAENVQNLRDALEAAIDYYLATLKEMANSTQTIQVFNLSNLAYADLFSA